MRITVETVASMAGVPRGTVDRVLHNLPNVRPEVCDRILEVMKELDYKPNAGQVLRLSVGRLARSD